MFKNTPYLKAGLLLIAAILVTGITLFENRSVQAGQSDNFSKKIIPSTQTPSAQTTPVKTNLTGNVQTISDLKIELIGVKVSNDTLQADVCFDLPSQADWLVSNSTDGVFATIGDQTINHSGFEEIDEKFDANGIRTQRCDRLYFPVGSNDKLSSFTITIDHLVTSMPEQPDCDKAQAKLDQMKTNIQIACDNTEGGFSFKVKSKPTELSDLDARNLVYSIFTDKFSGPWVFDTGVK